MVTPFKILARLNREDESFNAQETLRALRVRIQVLPMPELKHQ